MGILTDPNSGQGKLTKTLIKYYRPLSTVMYVCGMIWFCCIAHPWVNLQMYFSENALLPGLVKSEYRDEYTPLQFYNELTDEAFNHRDSVPYAWLLAKFRQIGLDTYTHNYTVTFPLGNHQKYTGKNVYGILRAARAASTEALVVSVPYRTLSSVVPTTFPSIAIMLAFAQFARQANYWSKDIIFIVTEHEQLGMQAWLEAYHSVSCGEPGVLNHGELHGRGGAIQAAINLEFHDIFLDRVELKIEGLNGQLPNLDLFNLCARMCTKIELHRTFKNREKLNQGLFQNWLYSFKTLLIMILSQATGIPDGNHGLFLRFGIQAVTIEGFAGRNTESTGFVKMGFILEGIFRSLNNLLERFHQSYFFYLLSAPDRFISIALYMPIIGLVAGALLVKACGSWYKSHYSKKLDKKGKDSSQSEEEDIVMIDEDVGTSMVEVLTVIVFIHIYGCVMKFSPKVITSLGIRYGLNTEVSLYTGFVIFSLLSLVIPGLLTITKHHRNMLQFKIVSLVEFGTCIICLSMYNCSLGLLIGAIYVPTILLMNTDNHEFVNVLIKVLWVVVHPFVILSTAVLIYTFFSFTGETFYENIVRGIIAMQQGVAYSVIDSMVYGNWLFNVITCIIVPNWICFWVVLFSPPKSEKSVVKPNKKDD